MASISILSCALLWGSAALANLLGIPTVPFTASGHDTFDFHTVNRVTVDSRYANSTDTDGWTLIPPTLWEFASTFREDLMSLTGKHVTLSCDSSAAVENGMIFLTVANSTHFKDAAGRWTSEGYQLDVEGQSVTVTGASPLGVWWGTRTILQQAILRNGSLAAGSGIDSPGWNTRGLFLDGGRHYYPPSFIIEMCNWISYWKQNIFHLHLSDNLYNNVDIYSLERQLELYARFRPQSVDAAVEGLNLHPNESYTRQDFDDIQYGCAARGVTLIPEIESPGHALVISQWKPQLGLKGEIDLLNISYPETIPTMKTIWNTFLPWFHSKVVHIGADEYIDPKLSTYQLGELYNTFVNAINGFIRSESGKSIRIWGTYPPHQNYTDNISKDVVIQHWEFFEDNPLFQYIDNGYNVINSDDHCYIVQKWSASYPQHLNRTLIFHGNPLGGAFAPYVFDPNNATNNPARDNPYVPGHIAAQWNDYGYNTSTYLEAYYSWRDLNAALADKQWGGHLTEQQYDDIFEKLQSSAPAQNLDRTISSKSSTILEYDFTSTTLCHDGIVKDKSGNGYDGKTNCSIGSGGASFKDGCIISSPLTSKGRDYTLSFGVLQQTSNPAPLFRGPDSELWSGNGSSTKIMLISAGNAFALNYSLPVGSWTDASLIARGNQTFFSVNRGAEMEFTTKIGVNGEYFVWANMAIVAPLAAIGGEGFEGAMTNVKLVDHA